ncbi:hypothetical protein ACFPL7_11060 [Dongia soli]|uniref:Uncharacterized protein n=1 Tax=Dongia soli TaxID=600628 RepID=A0ABU5EBQ3_9PROT|nr:hypothetical protein [Dongia soli]MDY0883489.1 hypothetical protein [Dongia soli]
MRERLHMEQEFQILLREFDNPQDAKKAAQAKAAAAKAAAQAKAERAKKLASAQKQAKELQPFFKQVLSRQIKPGGAKITYGPAVGAKVSLAVIADGDFEKANEAEAKRLAAQLQKKALKFAPDSVQRRLIAFYNAQGEALPSRLSVVDEKTRLTPDEDAAVFSIARAMTIADTKSEAAKVDGFYSSTTKAISLRESAITAGAIAHEMTHAYAHPNWHDFIYLMRVRGMKETDKLNEGMTSHLSGLVIDAWFAKQSGGTIPSTGYGPDYIAIANDFIKEVGQEAAFTAFFGGFVDFTDNDKPEDFLLIGSAKKKWKWKWR